MKIENKVSPLFEVGLANVNMLIDDVPTSEELTHIAYVIGKELEMDDDEIEKFVKYCKSEIVHSIPIGKAI